MAQKSLDIPVSDLPFEAGKGFFATVTEDGIAHIKISVADPKQKSGKTVSRGDGSEFLAKWGGSLTSDEAFQREDHVDDPRMLHYIDKYGLDA